MSSKTKIMVFHVKELIYTGIFILLGILFLVLIFMMFSPNTSKSKKEKSAAVYQPGVYATTLTLGGNTIDVEVSVDENHINSIQLVNLNDTITTMYPLVEPSFQNLVTQICKNQSLDGITYSNDNKYTTLVLLDAITNSLNKAKTQNEETP